METALNSLKKKFPEKPAYNALSLSPGKIFLGSQI